MNFIQIILERTNATLSEYNFQIAELIDDYVELVNSQVCISISHNKLENSFTLWLGKNRSNEVEVNDHLLKHFFRSNLKITNVPEAIFIDTVTSLINNDAKGIFAGDEQIIESLENFELQRSKEYTEELVTKQLLKMSDLAWSKKNYKEFVEIVEKINKDQLVPSYLKKIELAIKKISQYN